MDTHFNIHIVPGEHTLTVVVRGEVDVSTARLLDEELAAVEATDVAIVVVDLDGVEFIDSSGLHVLIKHALANQDSHRFRLTRGSPQVRRLLELSGAFEYLLFVASD